MMASKSSLGYWIWLLREVGGSRAMTVLWSGTSLEWARVSPVGLETGEAELEAHLIALRTWGEGYLEISRPGSDHPALAFSFRGGQAVVHGWTDESTIALLVGDGSVPVDEVVEVPVMDEVASFTGDFVSTVDRAWEVVRGFVRGVELAGLGEWFEL
jgi:hypothetical protein